MAREHVFIPDTQVRPGVKTQHILAAAHYIADRRPDVIIMAGDWWDMPSLSRYEKKGSMYFEGKRYVKDVEAGNIAMRNFMDAIKVDAYNPKMVFLMGNHEYRIQRAIEADPILEGSIGFDDLNLDGWKVIPFREIIEIDGILYSHFFQNPHSLMGNVLGGTIDNRLNKLKQSFTMGHQQTLMWGTQFLPTGRRIIGCVAGAFYQHYEEYQGPQMQHYWRGIIYKHEVHKGEYDPMMVSLDYLLKNY